MCLIMFWVCLVGLGSEGMQTHRLAPGNKGDLYGNGALGEDTDLALLDGLWSKPDLEESGEKEREGRESLQSLY